MFLFAFDLLELNGQDLRPEPLEARKLELGKLLRSAAQRACSSMSTSPSPVTSCSSMPARWGWKALSHKRLGSRYRSGRSPDWLKFKNPEAPAVRREAEEDLGQEGWR